MNRPKIAIIGYGKMGKGIEAQAKAQGLEISRILDIDDDISKTDFAQDEVAIEFTQPGTAAKNIIDLSEKGINVVCGTTAWQNKLSEVTQAIEKNGTALLHASNFSIGVAIFNSVVERAAQIINGIPEYDVWGHETHHTQKKDSPSGTAVTIANTILGNVDRKTTLETGRMDRPIKPEELHFSSSRGGKVFGTHSVFLDSTADNIEVTHTAKGRAGFANGAVKGAIWLKNKKGIFTMSNYLNDLGL